MTRSLSGSLEQSHAPAPFRPPHAPGRPRLSIIIPTLNEEDHLPCTLRALAAGLAPEDCEVIIADGGSTDATLGIARRHGCRTVLSSPGRARQLNAGARVARGDYFWFLHADTLPPADYREQLNEVMRTRGCACFQLRFDHATPHRLLDFFGRSSANPTLHFRFGDQSLLVPAERFRAYGGYADIPLLEGHELVRRIYRGGEDFRVLPGPVRTSARRYLQYGVVYTQTAFVLFYLSYRCGVSPKRIAQWYRRAFR